MLSYDELFLSDGTTTIDLLSLATRTGVHLSAWRAGASRYKDRGYWHNSAIAPGRRPAMHQWDAVEERITLDVVGWTPDDVARQTADVRNILQQAWDYFETNIPSAVPVYLIRRMEGETNREYSLVLGGFAPEDVDYAAMRSEYGTVSFDGWDITIWREEHWRDTLPGSEGVCLPNAGYEPVDRPCYIEFAANGIITIPLGANINNLMNNDFCAEIWVRFDTMAACQIFDKGLAGPAGWDLAVSAAGAVTATIQFTVADAIQNSVNGIVVIDTWYHIAMTWDNADNRPLIWIDGTQPAYAAGQDKNGAVVADAAHNLLIGNNVGLTADLQGDVGWARVSDTERYTVPFTPAPRCDPPALPWQDANTMGQWIGAECAGTNIVDMAGQGTQTYDGTLANGTFSYDCLDWVGNVDPSDDSVDYSCDEDDIEVFIRNGHTRAAVTQIWIEDNSAGTFTGNWVEESAYDLLPNPVEMSDAIYFGIDNGAVFYGPFFNLVFDLADEGVDIGGIWQYWSTAGGPGWQNMNIGDQDGTDELNEVGTCAITWIMPGDDWEVADPAGIGIAGYWMRFIVDTITATDPPVQQNRPVYTTNWASTEFKDTSVPGDVPALAYGVLPLPGEMEIYTTNDLMPSRVILALRSLSRGADFVPYFNFGDVSAPGLLGAQTPVGVTPSIAGGIGAQVVNDTRQQGAHVLATNTAVVTWESVQSWQLASVQAVQYYGQFRLYLRARAMALAGTVKVRALFYTSVEMIATTEEYTFLDTNRDKLIDLGIVSIPPYAPVHSTDLLYLGLHIFVQQQASNLADTVQYYDMFLCPIDEKVIEVVTVPAGTGTMHWLDKARLWIDSTTVLRTGAVRAMVGIHAAGADYLSVGWLPISVGPWWFQANADQRVWILAERYSGTYWYSVPQTHLAVLLRRIARYRSLRGAR